MEEQAAKPKSKKELDLSAVVNLAAYPAAGWAGLYAFKQNVRKDSVEHHTRLGNFNDATNTMRDAALKAEASGGKSMGFSTIQQAMAKLRDNYEEAKSLKFQSMGYKNVMHNWGDIADNNKMEAITTGFTVGAITLGAILMLANSKEIFKPIFKDPDDKAVAK